MLYPDKVQSKRRRQDGGRLHLFPAWLGRHDLGLPDRRPERVMLAFRVNVGSSLRQPTFLVVFNYGPNEAGIYTR